MKVQIKKWLSDAPTHCDLCGRGITEHFVDGKTVLGPWGIMCMTCHASVGCGLGVGRGQEYDLETLVKVRG